MTMKYTGRAVGGLITMAVAAGVGIHEQLSYDKDGFDKEGFDRDGYGRDGFDRQGIDRKGFDREGYDLNGYDVSGFNREGLDRSGKDSGFYAGKISEIQCAENPREAAEICLECLITHWQSSDYCHDDFFENIEICRQCNIITGDLADSLRAETDGETLEKLVAAVKEFA